MSIVLRADRIKYKTSPIKICLRLLSAVSSVMVYRYRGKMCLSRVCGFMLVSEMFNEVGCGISFTFSMMWTACEGNPCCVSH